MSGIAVAVSRFLESENADALVRAMPHRRGVHVPIELDGIAIAADVRPHDPRAASRVHELYARWGTDLAQHLEGDFAIAIVDRARRRIFCARDAFGVRPFFYAALPDRFLAASEVDAILAAGVSRELDDAVVLEFLLERYSITDRTFFTAIRRLRPGHRLVVENGVATESRWYRSGTYVSRAPRFADHVAEVRAAFRRAVERRLSATDPILAHLSGGLDSSSIVCTANAIYSAGAKDRPPLSAISALYPGLACDESKYIDAVASSVSFASERFDGTRSDFDDYTTPSMLHPGRPPTSGLAGEREIIAKTGAKSVLSGSGGDHVFFERGVFRDLASNGHFVELYRELTAEPRYGGASARELAKDTLRPFVPRFVKNALRKKPAPPTWLGARLREVWDRPSETLAEDAASSSHTQKETWRWLTGAPMCWNVEVQELDALRAGLEIHFPFLDATLVEHVLAVPWEHRVPKGRMKALLREAMSDVLPALVRERTEVTSFEPAVLHHVRRHLGRLEEILSGLDAARDFVEVKTVRARLEEVRKGEGTWRDATFLWDVAMLELFVRRSRRP